MPELLKCEIMPEFSQTVSPQRSDEIVCEVDDLLVEPRWGRRTRYTQ